MTIPFSLTSIGLLVLTLSWPVVASPASVGELTPFEVFQSLKGAWRIRAGDNTLPFEMTYALGSNGTIVAEQFGKELSVFYSDDGSLVMTHFCNRENQPRLKLKAGSRPGRYEFDMFDITNLKDVSDAHVQKMIYEILDPKHMNLEIIWKKGAGEESEKYVLTKLP
jgi:hypothetical protein